MERHGQLVFCNYGDEKFHYCVPVDNRKQLLHQATVTDLKYGVFVTAIAFEGESQIIQYVIVQFSQENRDEHYSAMQSVGNKIIGWLFNKDLLLQGYLTKEDCPEWMSEQQVDDCVSHYPMWSSLYTRVVESNDGDMVFKPIYPVGVFKHYQQFNYNKSKWGLDKNTEMLEHVFQLGMKVCF